MFYYFIEQTGDQNEAVETPLLEGYLHKCYIYMLYNDFLEVITTQSKKKYYIRFLFKRNII